MARLADQGRIAHASRMNRRGRGLAGMLVASAGLVIAGCKVGPDFEKPAGSSPEQFAHLTAEGFRAASTLDATRAPEVTWWRTLGDDKLNGLIDRAVAKNLDVRLAASRVLEARAERGVVASEWFPQVDTNGQYERSRGSKNAFGTRGAPGRNTDYFRAGFDASWEPDVFGRIARSVEAAEADIRALEEDRRNVVVSLLAEVARTYVELRGFQQRLVIAQNNINVQRDAVGLARSRFKAGLANDLDVAQAESLLATTESAVPTLDQGVQRSIHRLGVLLGQNPEELLSELQSPGPIPQATGNVPVGLPSELLRRRPDIRAAEERIAAATARIGVATAELFPRFSLTGSFGLASDKVADIADASSRFWSFGPAVRWPIFQGGRIRSNIRVQNAREEQALVNYERTLLSTFEEVENALVAYTREQARRESLKEAVASNQRGLDLARQLYKSGLADFQRVIDTQRSLFESQDQLVDSDRTVSSNLVAVYKALGGGWEQYEPPAPEMPKDEWPAILSR